MKLTSYTDYALRTLMDVALSPDRLITIQDIADNHGIARNHLTKVVHQLGSLGILETVRGRNGGLRLGMPPQEINIGKVVRQTESDFHMAECFGQQGTGCTHASGCRLKSVLAQATSAFFDVLDGVTLDMLVGPDGGGKAGTLPARGAVVPIRSLKRA